MNNNKYEVAQLLRFCTVGLGNTGVDLASFFILTLGGVSYLLAQVLSYSIGVMNSFFFNRKWTFRVAHKTSVSEIVKYAIVNGLSLMVSSGMLFVLHGMRHRDLWLSKLIVTGGSTVVNFLGSRLWVFTGRQAGLNLRSF